MEDSEQKRFSSFFYAPWHFLFFFPEPQGQGSLRPASFLEEPALEEARLAETLPIIGPELRISKTGSCLGSAICPPTFKAISAMALSIAASIRIKSPRPSFLYSTNGSFCP